jgi:uncharacterized PurR-regulated membrane protein YhhQ (DUF165 family)
MTDRTIAGAALAIYVGAIVAANWAITTYGLVPVGFGLLAPAGVYFAAVTFPARDVAQRAGGRVVSVLAILVGAAISFAVASPVIAVASGVTFLCSETLDFLVYSPLQRRWFTVAVVASGICASALDSWLFLTLAHIPMSAFAGTFLGKLWVVALVGGPVAFGLRRRLAVS